VNALQAVQQSEPPLQCVGFTEIGIDMQYPLELASRLAMEAIRDVLRIRKWTTKIVFVCIDPEEYGVLKAAKAMMEKEFYFASFSFPAVLHPTFSV
jgi:O-acetyl-ADP-ribose deacetylase (regulator of RNase III)